MYIINTTTTIADHLRDKYWIDSDYVKPMQIKADTLTKALAEYRNRLQDDYINVTISALRHKSPMYAGDGVQIGYVIKAHHDIDGHDAVLDLWAEIIKTADIDWREGR